MKTLEDTIKQYEDAAIRIRMVANERISDIERFVVILKARLERKEKLKKQS